MHICSTPGFAKSLTSSSNILSALKLRLMIGLLLVVVFTTGTNSHAQETDFQSIDESEYYTIDETQPTFSTPDTQNEIGPERFFSASVLLAKARNLAFSLLSWTLHAEAPKAPKEKYNRLLHFGRWVNDPNDKTCYNTRAKVLIRDSEAPVSFKEKNRCVVSKGTWYDPYVGEDHVDSREIQIDHMVPLKNAYVSGAWEWDYQTRCMYANFMGNKFHLISASGRENMRKGDRSPDRYMPPNMGYRCEYLENWLKIKLIWKLKLTPSEVDYIRQGIADNGCDPSKFSLSQRELRSQRKLINEHTDLCPAR